jgi:excinuclease UvrABC helicase subunit UvrB
MMAAASASSTTVQMVQKAQERRSAWTILETQAWKIATWPMFHGETIDKLERAVKVHDSEFKFPQRNEILAIEEIRKHLNAATQALTKCQDDAEGHRIQNQV